MELFDKDNNPIEGALSAEEVKAQIAEAETKAAETLETKLGEFKNEFDTKIVEKDKKIQELTDSLDSDLSDEDKNWKRTREAIAQLKQDKIDMKEDFDKKFNEVKGAISGDKIEARIKNIANGNKEMEDKIQFHYDSFGGEPKDEKAVQERLKNATLLAGGGEVSNDVLNGGAIRTGGGEVPVGMKTGGKISEEVKGVGDKMGITAEEYKDNKLL